MNETIRTQIAALEDMRLSALQACYAEVIGETTRTPNRRHLIRRVTEALLARAEGESAATTSPPEAPSEAQPSEPLRSPETHCESCGQRLVDGCCAECEARNTLDEQRRDDDPPAPSTAAATVDRPTESTESAATPAAEPSATPVQVKLSKLTVPELQARYFEVVGRPSGSAHRGYLCWKIRQAEKGRIPVGPRRERATATEPQDHKVLPLRMDTELVAKLDEARERLGLKSRMDLFRRALHSYLTATGEHDVAALFTPEG